MIHSTPAARSLPPCLHRLQLPQPREQTAPERLLVLEGRASRAGWEVGKSPQTD